MASSHECPVCVEKYNRSSRKPIACLGCGFEACTACVTKVLCGSTSDPCCMQCAKPWSVDFLVANFTKKFINETLKKHREQVLFERELGLLPASQPVAEQAIRRRQLADEKRGLTEQKQALQKQLFEVTMKIRNVGDKIYNLDRGGSGQDIVNNERRQFVRRCPYDNCMGFLSTAWKCGICSNWTCPDCHEVIGTDKKVGHICKPENIETAKLLAKDTKPCPKCAVPIHKIEGCSQMFCTLCHTAFDWNTLRIETGRIHNPRYFELQRRLGYNPREIGDMPCGGLPPIRAVKRHLQDSITDSEYQILSSYFQFITHWYEYERQRYIVNNLNDNLDLRVQYMLKELDENKFKQTLQMREKSRAKKREIEQVLATAFAMSVDIIQHLMNDTPDKGVVQKTIDNLVMVLAFAKEGFCNIQLKYGGVVPELKWTP